jgi:nitrogen fixation protein NifB
MDLTHHPCFNKEAHHRYGRVHLPVAPRCNIQCKFCNRKFDCVNESRPGVTSAVLSPAQAIIYLEEAIGEKPYIKVVGIAGPGDPFANAAETLETFERVRSRFPEMMLCVATNGLNLLPYLDDLKRLQVSHVTVTVNAVDPKIGEQIYSWMRIGKKVMHAQDGAQILLEQQRAAVQGLKERDIIVKINSIVLPGINEDHIVSVAREMAALGVDLFNCMPYYPSPGSAFECLPEPSAQIVAGLREQSGRYVKQMTHCTRCRSDAVGLLGEATSKALMATLKSCRHLTASDTEPESISSKPCVAVASMEGVLINQHLGEAAKLLIYGEKEGRIGLIESRPAPEPGSGMQRWQQLSQILSDCRMVLTSGAGENPSRVLRSNGIEVLTCEGLIDEAVRRVFAGESLKHMAVRRPTACSAGSGCGGNSMGCG